MNRRHSLNCLNFAPFRPLSLCLSAPKSHLLVVCLKDEHSRLTTPLLLRSGDAVKEVSSAKYLGVVLDSRLSLERHWCEEAGKLRAIVGASHRLLKGQPQLFRLLVTSVAEGRIRHSLPATPPTTDKGWAAVKSAFVLAGRLLLNEWTPKPDGSFGFNLGADAVLDKAGFHDPRQLAGHLGLELVYKAHKLDRLWGQHLDLQRRSGVTRLASSSALTLHTTKHLQDFPKTQPILPPQDLERRRQTPLLSLRIQAAPYPSRLPSQLPVRSPSLPTSHSLLVTSLLCLPCDCLTCLNGILPRIATKRLDKLKQQNKLCPDAILV